MNFGSKQDIHILLVLDKVKSLYGQDVVLDENTTSNDYSKKILASGFLRNNKYPILVTIGFFICLSFVSFFINVYWSNYDGFYYIKQGEAILNGNGLDIKAWNAPIGGPIAYAAVNFLIKDSFVTLKLFALFGGAALVFISYFIIRNIFSTKIALAGQLLVAFNTQLHWPVIQAGNELLALSLIFGALYVMTRKHLQTKEVVITSILLGVAFLVRYQTLFVLVAFLIFLMIRNRNYRLNLMQCGLVVSIFLVLASSLFLYNYLTYGKMMDSDPGGQMIFTWKYQTPEWTNKAEQLSLNGQGFSAIFLDFDLSLKNYFYNIFYYNSNRLFGFDTTYSLSVLPYFHYLGVIPALIGLLYILKIRLTKTIISVAVSSFIITTILIVMFGDIKYHFFALVIIPVLVLGMLHIRNVDRNFLPLLVLSVVYFMGAAILPLGRADHLLPMWLSVPILSSLFFIYIIPKTFSKICRINFEQNKSAYLKIIILIMVVVLSVNMVFSMRMQELWLYDDFKLGLKDAILGLFQKHEPRSQWGEEIKEIGDVLSRQPGIENSYVMGAIATYSYYANSKFVYADFQEGKKGDPIEKFITRENWSEYDIYFSNLNSHPPDRRNIYKPMPDYIVYFPLPPSSKLDLSKTQYEEINILTDPTNPKIPNNFEFLYKENKTGTVVYKIHHKR
jgi:hypothetical protein